MKALLEHRNPMAVPLHLLVIRVPFAALAPLFMSVHMGEVRRDIYYWNFFFAREFDREKQTTTSGDKDPQHGQLMDLDTPLNTEPFCQQEPFNAANVNSTDAPRARFDEVLQLEARVGRASSHVNDPTFPAGLLTDFTEMVLDDALDGDLYP